VLIPNSYFISEKVKNWTLHNYSGRIVIAIGVHYDCDPRKVRDILLKVAKAHPQVMANPEPFVYFEDFAADALTFKLYAYVYDITKSFGLRTDLRIAIFEAFREEGVEIPYRQTDIHLQGLDWLKEALSGSAQRGSDAGPGGSRHAKAIKRPAFAGRGNGERAYGGRMRTRKAEPNRQG
jgi:small-conductance mechanosensitive channel